VTDAGLKDSLQTHVPVGSENAESCGKLLKKGLVRGVDPCVGLSLLGESFRPEESSSLEFEEEITLWKPRLMRNVLEKTPFGVDSCAVRFWGIIRGWPFALNEKLSEGLKLS
jgi:hypothetical protein